ncbi:MAG: hypothetical protein JXQ83_05910 [Candidatus Glassbacteria bacterium]|nr:hypothetical protein [Candidatus Glassbacteria bacterium]
MNSRLKPAALLAGLIVAWNGWVMAGPALENELWRAGFDPATGAIVSLAASNGVPGAAMTELLSSGPAGIVVYDVARGLACRPGDPACRVVEISPGPGAVRLVQEIDTGKETLTLTADFRLNGGEIEWRASIRGEGRGNRSLRVWLELPLPEGWELWVQPMPGTIKIDRCTEPFSYWYVRAPEGYDKLDNQYPRHDLSIPQVSLIRKDLDLGITVAHPVDGRMPSSGFVGDRPAGKPLALQAVTALVGLRGKQPLEVSGYLVAHRGCYRPGLEWVLDKWPEYFLPEEGIYRRGGIYSTGYPGMGAADEQGAWNYRHSLELGAYFMEIHMHFPWYGLYFPGEEDPALWSDVHRVERGTALDSTLSVEKISRLMNNLAEAGFHTFYYYAINDGYPPEAEKRWPEAVASWPRGKVQLSGWRGGGIEYRSMNPDTAFSFGRDLVRQADGILEKVHPLAGLFFDTVHHNDLDFAHDDGTTLVYLDGQSVPAYSINFGYDFFLRYLSQRLHERGQHLFINGPAAVRNALGVDAVMLEGQGYILEAAYEFEHNRFLTCMTRPLYWLFPARPTLRREVMLQRCLLYGGFPTAPHSVRTDRYDDRRFALDKELWEPYLPLYESLRGRVLCFEPDPVSVPWGYRAEVFTLPDGRYAATLINEGSSVFEQANGGPLEVGLRLARPVSSIRLVTPLDHEGTSLEAEQGPAGGLRVRIPDFRGAAVLFLTPE